MARLYAARAPREALDLNRMGRYHEASSLARVRWRPGTVTRIAYDSGVPLVAEERLLMTTYASDIQRRTHILYRLISATILAASCSSGSGSPAGPDTEPFPKLAISVSPTPVPAIPTAATSSSVTLLVAGEVTFSESAGVAGRITRVSGEVILDGITAASASLNVDLPFTASGSTGDLYSQEFVISELFTTGRWRFSASGVDAMGRSFQVPAVEVQIELTVPPAPSSDVLLFGDSNYDVFLGCFSCSRFDSESVHNPFGQYGSRFSSTSIWNHFSQYGSPFSTHSACNEFASNPPILVDNQGAFYGELTLNLFRPNAVRDPDVVDWLRHVVCEE